VEEHEKDIRRVFETLKKNQLYCNPKKTKLFQYEVNFLGHHISRCGIEADCSKVERIINWPQPKSSTNVRAFLGLVRYIAKFLPNLAEHTCVLEKLTTKDCDKSFPKWTDTHQLAFDAVMIWHLQTLFKLFHGGFIPYANGLFHKPKTTSSWILSQFLRS
jgi:hypothetical protein